MSEYVIKRDDIDHATRVTREVMAERGECACECHGRTLDGVHGCCARSVPDERDKLEAALSVAIGTLRRLADPTEMAGMGDASEPHNATPEMRARIAHAGRELQRITSLITCEAIPGAALLAAIDPEDSLEAAELGAIVTANEELGEALTQAREVVRELCQAAWGPDGITLAQIRGWAQRAGVEIPRWAQLRPAASNGGGDGE